MQPPTYVYMNTSMCAYSSVYTYTALLSKRQSAKDNFSLDQIYLQQISVTTKIWAYIIIMRHNHPPQRDRKEEQKLKPDSSIHDGLFENYKSNEQ